MNRATLIGRICNDIELRYTDTNIAHVDIDLAVNNGKNKDGNDRPADFIRIEVWDKLAENLSKYQAKGNKLFVEGPIKTVKWENEQGEKKYKTYVRANNIIFLDSKFENKRDVSSMGNYDMNLVTPADFEPKAELKPEPEQLDILKDFESELPF